jgi:hypothetical protein
MPTSPPTISALGTPPSRTQTQTEFTTNANALFGALPTFRSETNAVASNVYANAVEAAASAVTAAAAAVTASAADANVAAMANFKGNWSALTGALAKPASVFHNGAFWALLNNLADVTTSQPGVSADWQVCGGAWPIVPINSTTTAQAWRTYLITGACSLTLPAISGNGQQVKVIVLPGVTGAVVQPAGSDKVRGTAGAMTVDGPFDQILSDSGATYGWV